MQQEQRLTQILALDRAGNPSAWINTEMAVHLTATDRVLAPLGEHTYVCRGGVNRVSGERSTVELSSILLTNAKVIPHLWDKSYAPHLTNRALFARDDHICQYCGNEFSPRHLTRDHIMPTSRGGPNIWTNVTTACFDCNNKKQDMTPEEWGVRLLAVPYAPCYAEHLILQGRNILADQAAFLRARITRKH